MLVAGARELGLGGIALAGGHDVLVLGNGEPSERSGALCSNSILLAQPHTGEIAAQLPLEGGLDQGQQAALRGDQGRPRVWIVLGLGQQVGMSKYLAFSRAQESSADLAGARVLEGTSTPPARHRRDTL